MSPKEKTPTPSPASKPAEEELTVGQYEELKGYIKKLTDAINSRLAGLDAKTAKLAEDVKRATAGKEKSFGNYREYTVKSGDTLSIIAKRELGQAGRFTEIGVLNYDRYPSLRKDLNLIQAGWVLRLPD